MRSRLAASLVLGLQGLQLSAALVASVFVFGSKAPLESRAFVLLGLLSSGAFLLAFRKIRAPRTPDIDHSDEAKHRDFVSAVSHELRTPVAAILGYLELAEDEVVSDKPTLALSRIEVAKRNALRLQELCSDLLALGKLEHEEIEKSSHPVREITHAVMERFAQAIRSSGHEVFINEEARHIEGDAGLIEQVLNNLFENALRYTPPGTKINISWLVQERGVLLSVADNGPGIAPEHHLRLFERFYRVAKGRSRTEGGTGLGLAVARSIVLRHRGKIWVDSRLGEGAVFNAYFPRD